MFVAWTTRVPPCGLDALAAGADGEFCVVFVNADISVKSARRLNPFPSCSLDSLFFTHGF